MKIGIIGTAGRKPTSELCSKELYFKVVEQISQLIVKEIKIDQTIDLVSGGAAFMDHCAVTLWHQRHSNPLLDNAESIPRKAWVDSLTLHFPAPWIEFPHPCFHAPKGQSVLRSDGATANYYHGQFSTRMGKPADYSLRSIQTALESGAKFKVYPGFKPRNLVVGEVDWLIAGTFGEKDRPLIEDFTTPVHHIAGGLKDGGTAHTWDHSSAPHKTHINLWRLL